MICMCKNTMKTSSSAYWCVLVRIGAASRKTKEEARESVSEIRVAYRTLHQRNALSDTRQRH